MGWFKYWWNKIFSFLSRAFIANKCGHWTKKAGWARAFGERYFVEMPLAGNGRPDHCLGCIGSMAIRCAGCGDAIHIGDPVTLYSPKKDFAVPGHAVRYSEDPLRLVGCLRWDCAETVADRAGFWMPPGEVHRVPTIFEQLMDELNPEAIVISDLGDPHDVGTVIGGTGKDRLPSRNPRHGQERPMKVKGMEVNVSGQWTHEERVAVATVLLRAIQDDVYRGTYSEPGRPNITSVLHVLHENAEFLNKYHNELECMLMSIDRDIAFQGKAS